MEPGTAASRGRASQTAAGQHLGRATGSHSSRRDRGRVSRVQQEQARAGTGRHWQTLHTACSRRGPAACLATRELLQCLVFQIPAAESHGHAALRLGPSSAPVDSTAARLRRLSACRAAATARFLLAYRWRSVKLKLLRRDSCRNAAWRRGRREYPSQHLRSSCRQHHASQDEQSNSSFKRKLPGTTPSFPLF